MERRDILKSSLAAAGIAALGAAPAVAEKTAKPPKAKLRIW